MSLPREDKTIARSLAYFDQFRSKAKQRFRGLSNFEKAQVSFTLASFRDNYPENEIPWFVNALALIALTEFMEEILEEQADV